MNPAPPVTRWSVIAHSVSGAARAILAAIPARSRAKALPRPRARGTSAVGERDAARSVHLGRIGSSAGSLATAAPASFRMKHRNVFPCRAALLALGLFLSTALASCTSTGKAMPRIAPQINATLESSETVLSPGDVVELTFPEKTDWNQSVRVRPDGHASFAGIDDIVVAGLTVPKLGDALRVAYGRVFTTPPAIAVGVSTLASRNVYVLGEVSEPGPFPVEGRITLTDALALAGGFVKPTAALRNVMLVRYSPRENRQHVWNIDARIEHWGKGDPIFLQAFDTLLVPNTAIDDVDIWVDQYIRQLIPFPYLVAPAGTP